MHALGLSYLKGPALRLSARATRAASLAAIVMFAATLPAMAQSRGASYLPPFPKGDTYNILVIGDDYGYGLRSGLEQALSDTSRVRVEPRHYQIKGLFRTNIEALAPKLENELKSRGIAIVVVMIGARDAVSIRNAKGQRFQVGTDVWRKEYAARIDQLNAVFRGANVASYWVGLPVTSRNRTNEGFRVMNEILREQAYRDGLKFVDIYPRFTDERDGFAAYGPDLSGETRLMRSRDGIFFTDAGNQKLAYFTEKLIRRDLKQARNDRQIPLAGSEAEQARIHAGKREAAGAPVASGAADTEASAAAEGASETAAREGAGGEKENHGKISLRVRGPAGNEDTIVLDILRPAVPASVVNLIQRRAKPDEPAEIGDTLVDNIPGGLTVMSSIAPSSTGAPGRRRILSPTQTPFFRVLVKGEPLQPRPGRIDDFSWPKSVAGRAAKPKVVPLTGAKPKPEQQP